MAYETDIQPIHMNLEAELAASHDYLLVPSPELYKKMIYWRTKVDVAKRTDEFVDDGLTIIKRLGLEIQLRKTERRAEMAQLEEQFETVAA